MIMRNWTRTGFLPAALVAGVLTLGIGGIGAAQADSKLPAQSGGVSDAKPDQNTDKGTTSNSGTTNRSTGSVPDTSTPGSTGGVSDGAPKSTNPNNAANPAPDSGKDVDPKPSQPSSRTK